MLIRTNAVTINTATGASESSANRADRLHAADDLLRDRSAGRTLPRGRGGGGGGRLDLERRLRAVAVARRLGRGRRCGRSRRSQSREETQPSSSVVPRGRRQLTTTLLDGAAARRRAGVAAVVVSILSRRGTSRRSSSGSVSSPSSEGAALGARADDQDAAADAQQMDGVPGERLVRPTTRSGLPAWAWGQRQPRRVATLIPPQTARASAIPAVPSHQPPVPSGRRHRVARWNCGGGAETAGRAVRPGSRAGARSRPGAGADPRRPGPRGGRSHRWDRANRRPGRLPGPRSPLGGSVPAISSGSSSIPNPPARTRSPHPHATMSPGISKATCPHRLSRQRAATTAPWASCTALGSTEPRASSPAASRLARAGDSFFSSCLRSAETVPLKASTSWGSETWLKTARSRGHRGDRGHRFRRGQTRIAS